MIKSVNKFPYKTIRSAKNGKIKFANIDEKNNLIYVKFYDPKNKQHKVYKFEFNNYNENVIYENLKLQLIKRW